MLLLTMLVVSRGSSSWTYARDWTTRPRRRQRWFCTLCFCQVRLSMFHWFHRCLRCILSTWKCFRQVIISLVPILRTY